MSLSNHTLILKNDGTLWGCGYNKYGQLGLGQDTSNKNIFTQITTNADNTKSIYCGCDHTFILKNDGTLWGCGRNNYYQLGLGDANHRTTFTIIGINTNDIESIYCGGYHTLILKNNGTLWGCGRNGYGQLGLGDTTHRYTFTQITTNTSDIKSIHCGCDNTFILKNDGTLWACGYNNFGQLGLGDTSIRTTLTQVTTNTDNIKSVYCGYNHTLILKKDGTLWACGQNNAGQLGLGDDTSRYTFTQITVNTGDIKTIYCGVYCTFILKNDGTLLGCGYNNHGELGLGDTTNKSIFTIVKSNPGNIKSIYCGMNHTLILKNDSTLWASGYNGEGELGLGDTTDRTTFTQITTNVDNIKKFVNDYNTPNTIKIYDTEIGYTETLDTNNFRNIPVDKFEKLKVLHTNPTDTYLNCLISFDKKQTWKMFDGLNWNTISDISPQNIISNGMEVSGLNSLDKKKLIAGGFTGDLDFKIAMKTNNKTVTSSVTKIYIEYK